MDKRSTTGKVDPISNQSIETGIYRDSLTVVVNETNPVFKKLLSEGCENFFKYFELLGLANDPSLIVLPSTHHYYYDAEDMKEVKTVVNMKQLNHIKDIKEFLHTIYHILSPQSLFVGIFIDRKYQNGFFSNSAPNQSQTEGKVDPVEHGIESRIPFLNMVFNIMDSKTNRYMSKQAVKILLGDAGFKVIDLTEINGLTYFCIQKVKLSVE
jgi:hypothetical protein